MRFIRESQKLQIATLNQQALANPAALVQQAEDDFDAQLDRAVQWIAQEPQRFIFLTGPSASGKTTTTKMLIQRLEELGRRATYVSLDNFYKSREDIPLWEDGSKNFEALEALDLAYLEQLAAQLTQTGHAQFPLFDFREGKRREKTFPVVMDGNSFVVFEGIHALNPYLTDKIQCVNCLRIYVSPHSIFTDNNNEQVLGTEDLRLVRRIVRDHTTRGFTADRTIEMWHKVRRGELEYIRPYRSYADIHINSTHAYEPMLYVEELRACLDECHTPEIQEVRERLLTALGHFERLDIGCVPGSSLLREFLPALRSRPE